MSKKFALLVIVLVLVLFNGCRTDRVHEHISLIPLPVEMEMVGGQFVVVPETPIVYDDEQLASVARYASALLGLFDGDRSVDGFSPDVQQAKDAIRLRIITDYDDRLGDEGYYLAVQPDGISISANGTAGVFYGVQTLSQLLDSFEDGRIPGLHITDYPRFAYRGLHLDVSRHFMPIEFIFRYIDYMAMHKLNVFHWHLIDDQGWRLEIKKYPKLTEVGAWRVDMPEVHWNERPLVNDPDNATYGGYYTEEEVRAVVEYAAARHIRVMPEIEMPAHVMSALAAYPEYSCTGENLGVPPGGVWPITHIYCAGNEATFTFLEDILLETMELFPYEYIHIGGDEADKTNWKACPECQARMEAEGLADVDELQSYFIGRIEAFLNAHGRQIIGWDEILEGGLAPNATVMSWRGEQGGIEAARMGHNVVMTPGSHCYFDHYQGDPAIEPLAIGGYTTLAKVYSYEPVPEVLTEEEARLVMGAQANVWTEYMPTPDHVEYMVFPRLAALSEVLWTPAEHRHWGDFSRRMKTQYKRYDRLGINYSLSAFQVKVKPEIDPLNKKLMLNLHAEAYQPEIRYTLDGSDPDNHSPLYHESIAISESGTLKAAVFVDNRSMQQVLKRDFIIHKAFAAETKLVYPNSPHYDGHGPYSLVNGIRGTKSFSDGNWKGFSGHDMIAVIDLLEPQSINGISVDALQTYASWIFLPREVRFEVSADGISYQLLDVVDHHISPYESRRLIHVFSTSREADDVRFIRVHAKNLGFCPPGHSGEGEPAWLFVSEIELW
ncbi:MAG: beta-N-acetylhexosaminidase [Bacteroidia bacterium]|nr:MAG: beta-N-acetylhexosaminidase [Bacteroidia bacterium]